MDWPNIVMAVATAAAVVVAVLALGHSRKATRAAAGAVLEAKDANAIAQDANKIAKDANKIAERSHATSVAAAQDARDAPTAVAWDELLVALMSLQTADPTDRSLDAAPLLTAVRTRLTLLIDRVDWPMFDTWLAVEYRAAVMLMHEAAKRGHEERQRLGRDLTAEEALDLGENFLRRVTGIVTNVRMCRREGPTKTPFEALTENAREGIKNAAERNGWEVPSEKIEGWNLTSQPRAGRATTSESAAAATSSRMSRYGAAGTRALGVQVGR